MAAEGRFKAIEQSDTNDTTRSMNSAGPTLATAPAIFNLLLLLLRE